MTDSDHHAPGRPNPHHDRAAGVASILVLGAALYLAFLLLGLIPRYDALTLFSPYFSLTADLARSGQLLLWNPWVNCGSPDLAYVEMGSFSPLTVILAFLTGGGHLGFLFYWVAIWTIFGVGSVLLALHLDVPRGPAIAVAVAAMFSGFFVSNATSTSWLYGFCFLPLILWRLDASLIGGRPRFAAAEAGALYGLSALAGHPALVILDGIFLGLWTAGRVMFPPPAPVAGTSPGSRLRTAAVALTVLLGVAVVVMSPAYFAFFQEGAGFSERAGYLPRALAVNNKALPAGALVTLSSPWFSAAQLKNPAMWGDTLLGLSCCYAGWIIPALALVSLLAVPRGRFRWWVLGIGLFFLAAAMGDRLPVRGWLYDFCPPTRFFRHSSVMRAHFIFALTVLAMMGARELPLLPRLGARLTAGLVALGLAAAVAFAVASHSLSDRTGWWVAATQLFLGWAVVAWWMVESRAAGRAGRPPRLGTRVLVAAALVDGVLSLYLLAPITFTSRAQFSALEQGRVTSVDLAANGFRRERFPAGSILIDVNLFDKVPYLENFNQLSNRFHSRQSLTPLPSSWSDEPVLSAAALGPDRIWFSPVAAVVYPSDATFKAFVDRARQLGAVPLLLHRPDDYLMTPPRGAATPLALQADQIPRLPACRRVPVGLTEYTPTRLAFSVTVPEKGWLLVTDRWSSNWRAQVDGQPVELLAADFLFRAVALDAGTHQVEFDFRPRLHPLLVYLSWGLMMMIGTVSIWRGQRPGPGFSPRPPAL